VCLRKPGFGVLPVLGSSIVPWSFGALLLSVSPQVWCKEPNTIWQVICPGVYVEIPIIRAKTEKQQLLKKHTTHNQRTNPKYFKIDWPPTSKLLPCSESSGEQSYAATSSRAFWLPDSLPLFTTSGKAE
jgi:hypothetical protein